MSGSNKKNSWFYLVLLAIIIISLELIGWLAMRVIDENYLTIRQILLGNQEFVGKHYTIGQPYLLFTASPGMEKHGHVQHNEHGYRGKKVPLRKEEGNLRLLFLGGSTTYGMWVTHPDSTYPAQVGHMLEALRASGDARLEQFSGIEVLNAGVPWGSTAEILTHYHFKYRYYQPDMVIVNTGGNDAYFVADNYQPDYSHFRKAAVDIYPVKETHRWMFRSRLLSFFVINLFYDDFVKGGQFVHGGEFQKIKWFNDEGPYIDYSEDLRYNAFFQNISKTANDVLKDESGLLLVPFLGNWEDPYFTDTILSIIHHHNSLLEKLAADSLISYVPFHENVIGDKSLWMDDCHLNTAGTTIKARLVASHILDRLNQKEAGSAVETP